MKTGLSRTLNFSEFQITPQCTKYWRGRDESCGKGEEMRETRKAFWNHNKQAWDSKRKSSTQNHKHDVNWLCLVFFLVQSKSWSDHCVCLIWEKWIACWWVKCFKREFDFDLFALLCLGEASAPSTHCLALLTAILRWLMLEVRVWPVESHPDSH